MWWYSLFENRLFREILTKNLHIGPSCCITDSLSHTMCVETNFTNTFSNTFVLRQSQTIKKDH